MAAAGLLNTYDQSRSEYINRLMSFDPQQYLQQANGAAVSGALEQYGYDDAGRRTSLNASGFRPNSAMGGAGIVRDLNDRVARAVASNSLQAGQMEQGRVDSFGGVAAQDLERYTSERELELAQQNAARQESAQNKGSLLGLAGTLGGAILGGPLGSKIGGALGGAVGKLFHF